MDVDLIKSLIKAYNHMTHGYQKEDKSFLCPLDREIFIEVFDLGGPMTYIIEQDKLNKSFKIHEETYP